MDGRNTMRSLLAALMACSLAVAAGCASNPNSSLARQCENGLSVAYQELDFAKAKGFDAPGTKAQAIVEWLKEDYGVGRGHAMALVHVIKHGPRISDKHVNSGGSHSDPSNLLHLDGKANR